MKQFGAALALVALTHALSVAQAVADPGQEAIAKMAATWDQVNTYQCTVSVHEEKGARVQDRVYFVRFARPSETRVDIVGGDGRGSSAVWTGGDRVRGHEGGLLSAIKLNVDLNSKFATDLRGTTIDQANFGAMIARLKSLDPSFVHVTTDGGKTVLVVEVDPSPPNDDVTKQVYILGPDWLPAESFEYAEDKVVRHVVNSELKVNLDMPASTWQL